MIRRSTVAVLLIGALIAPVSLTTTQAQAQKAAELGKAAQKQLGELSKLLNLSDAQKAKLGPFLQQEAEQVKTLKADETLSKEAKETKLRSIKEETTGKMKSELSAEQFGKLTDWHKQAGDKYWKKW